jgi:NADH dehydrogenase FAD-containing subunit
VRSSPATTWCWRPAPSRGSFGTPGAEDHAFHLYSLLDAKRLRSRLFGIFEQADVHPARIDQGALNIVIVGGGPTGVETAGAVADLVADIMPRRFHDLPVERTRIYLVDNGPVVLNGFSDKAHEYAKRELERAGITVLLNTGVEEIRPDRVRLSNGTEILTRTVVWAGGVQAASLAQAAGVPQGPGGRLGVTPELTVEGFPRVYAVGDIANIRDADGKGLPQLGSVALQAGRWAARNILADIDGHTPTPFHYKDKGIMAMIGDGAAVAERAAPRRAARPARLRRVAGRARLADERCPTAGRRLPRLGLGLRRVQPPVVDHRRSGRRPDRLGRRSRGRRGRRGRRAAVGAGVRAAVGAGVRAARGGAAEGLIRRGDLAPQGPL